MSYWVGFCLIFAMPDDEVTSFTFRLPVTMRERLRQHAALSERSESGFLRFHLAQILDLIDDGSDEFMDEEDAP